MGHTVVGFFDNQSEANEAIQRLTSLGITRDSIDLSSGRAGTEQASHSDSTDRGDRHESGITRFFKSLFGDDDEASDRYSRVAHNSSAIVTVHCRTEEEAERAADLLDDCGAVDVDERSSQYGNAGNTRGNSDETTRVSGDRSDRDASIERVEENLEVGKRAVEGESVRVRSRIVQRPVEENVRLREEHVHVERQPVDRPVSGDELDRMEDRDIEMRERSEVPVVHKTARVVEEVRVSKDVSEHNETIRDNVRRTEIDVDRQDGNDTSDRSTRNSRTDSEDDSRNII